MNGEGTMRALERVVDDRVFLLGLDQHYRQGMKLFESKVLLGCAAAVAGKLGRAEKPVPVEGYYADPKFPQLARYFRLMRALQDVTEEEAPPARGMAELERLREVASSPMYGRPQYERQLDGERMMLPAGRDPLTDALLRFLPGDWDQPALLSAARAAALERDDFSLVGLAARAGDGVVLAALRESVVLYAEKMMTLSAGSRYTYAWRVDPGLARAADRFIAEYNRLVATGNAAVPFEQLMAGGFDMLAQQPIPAAAAESAGHFYRRADDNEIAGRCVHLGKRIDTGANYHWAVRHAQGGGLELHDFWDKDLWTTERYRREKPSAAPAR